MILKDIIGHKMNIHNMANAIKEGKFAHAHLIVGEDGIGKSVIAKGIALEILGLKREREHIDILQWRIGKNKKSIGVNEIRELIKEVNKRPFEGDKKVIIVHDGNNLTPQAQNAFLKTIEEPPKGVFIIVLSDNLESILGTIQSRCQIHKLRKLANNDMEKFIHREHSNISEDLLQMVLSFSEGIPGRAERFLEDEIFKELRVFSIEFFKSKVDNKLFECTSKLLSYKADWDDLYSCLVNLIRDMIIIKECYDESMILNKDYLEDIKSISDDYSYKSLINMLKSINKTNENIVKNLNFNIAIEVMLLELQEV
ncbi:DNA polymerase III subunit delta' [Oceanirhabdus sp. W0125-5]|uniref:DNA polymerase III subunit delta' n=1 Tax=Oceanirhabdus sp. W0125-5 TaxID=2999116 RepID=UPI0022F2BB23|nr:DNA polymerase III subunit delta' [Oceanirhabdus sp. W0125-5]WBW97494.1 DNA polymerase III subunit delta' [Oceanirhabdus sp. W0125-5]